MRTRDSFLLDGKPHRVTSPRDAHDLGIGMVYQHFTLVPNMSVAENLLLSRSHLPGVVKWRAEKQAMEAFLETMPFSVDLSATVAALSAGEKQKLEILKQLYLDSRILIFDEPTSVLTPGEADEILGLLRRMTQANELSVLMITHKLREVSAYAEEVTVLRQGRVVRHRTCRGAITHRPHANDGRHDDAPPADGARAATYDRPVRLKLSELSADDDKGHRALAGVSLEVCGGEIVGIAGVSGNGQREMTEVLGRSARTFRRSSRGSWCALSRDAVGDASPEGLLPAGGAAAQRLRGAHDGVRESCVSLVRRVAVLRRWLGH